jgi:endonuclease/exonuclease/phosphatase family metal-dependent hydrolase
MPLEMKKLLALFSIFISFTVSAAQTKSLSVLTYNVWMVQAPFKIGSLDIPQRALVLAENLNKTKADVIFLQEVWPDKIKKQLVADFKKLGYEYSFYEDRGSTFLLRGLVGNGLMIISKFPLEIPNNIEQRTLVFTDYTRPDEYFAAKGALHVRLRLSDKTQLSLYNTHLGAVSFEPKLKQFNLKQETARKKQSNELFKFIKATSQGNSIVLGGDFNTHLHTFSESGYTSTLVSDYESLTCFPFSEKCMALVDSFQTTQGSSPRDFTHDPEKNQYCGRSPVYVHDSPKSVIDYIFVSKTDLIKISSSQVVLNENLIIPGRKAQLPLSDHYGIISTIQVSD